MEFVSLEIPYSTASLRGNFVLTRDSKTLAEITLVSRWESRFFGIWWNSAFKTKRRFVIIPVRQFLKAGPIDVRLQLQSNIESEHLDSRVGFRTPAHARISVHGRFE